MEFTTYLRAGYPVIWVRTSEADRAQSELAAAAKKHPSLKSECFVWDIDLGVRAVNVKNEDIQGALKAQDPLNAVKFAARELPGGGVLFMHNLHRCLHTFPLVQAILNALPTLKQTGKSLVILSPLGGEALPAELAKQVVAIDFALPTKEELKDRLQIAAEGGGVTMPPKKEQEAIIAMANGLTAREAEDAFSLSLVEKDRFDPDVIMDIKAQIIRKQGILQVERYEDALDKLAGMENAKEYILKTANHPKAKGILLLGVPGTGKTTLAQCVARRLGRIPMRLNCGALFGSKVGESEHRTIDTLAMVDAMEPSVLFIDELEKGIQKSSSGETDGGTSARVFGTFLSWLSDRKSMTYVIATCNDITKIDSEFTRNGRWDTIFFVDLPTDPEKLAILDIWMKEFKIDPKQTIPDMTDWTGAEIREMCLKAHMMDCSLVKAATYINPIAIYDSARITALREWARGRTTPASKIAGTEESTTNKRVIRRAI